jgi:hypothetical protein
MQINSYSLQEVRELVDLQVDMPAWFQVSTQCRDLVEQAVWDQIRQQVRDQLIADVEKRYAD